VRRSIDADVRRTLARGELAQLVYRLGRHAASGVLTLSARGARPEVFVLRRGGALCAEGELGRRALAARLARSAAEPSIAATFEGGVAACPPGALHQLPLAGWARAHLEGQLDGALAEVLVHQLSGCSIALRSELAPEPLDDTDRRMLAALRQPSRLDQIWPLARAPRFRLLALLYFLRATGALELEPAAARGARAAVRSINPRRAAAMQLLGLDDSADTGEVKRAYRRLARTLHPDLQPHLDEQRRRVLERRFAELTAAYEALADA
jgi:hypothetical protein